MILPWKLITLRETDLNGWCTRESFVSGREQDFEKEKGNQSIGACLPLSLSIFFYFFSSKILLSYLFSHCFFFLILLFYFLVLKFLIPQCLSPLCTRQRTPFIVPAMTVFYYFGPQQPLSGLGVLADHHWSVCVPLLIAKQRKTIFFVCLPSYPFLLWFGCLLSPHPLWHAPNGSNSTLLLLGVMSSQQDTFPKRARVGTSK